MEDIQRTQMVIEDSIFNKEDALIKDVENSDLFQYLLTNHPYKFKDVIEIRDFCSYLKSNKAEQNIGILKEESLISSIEEFRKNN